ncbi:ATP-dependent helicase [Ornithinimicrobium tianjinense]|uniref:DNA 3'-5' helicase n=1 Tax=Ornithinimicrobium tianjinense TaxID=1195761 RepID=A0A917BX10_9MICO|nr:ATP-dependent DNA helicase [Ornithinimicrobium tianjinense]GGF59829.1 DNA helicase [Ornithinimicrobium tianjinense]
MSSQGTPQPLPPERRTADPEQQAVVAHRGGVLLVLGGPGTGKTTAVVGHAQERVLRDGSSPDSCLVLAPTRQAAARLRSRIGQGLGTTFAEPLARTPSSLAFSVLRLAAAAAGEPLPRLLSGAEQDVILRELLAGHVEQGSGPEWPASLTAALSTAGFRGQLRDLLMRAVEHGLEPSDLDRLGDIHGRPEWGAAARVLAEYDEVTALSDPGSFDPAWICTAAADLLEDDPDLLATVRGRIRALVVDDAQELTASAARLVSVLHRPGADLLLVGDPDATVLGFRGAVPGRFIDLARQLAGDEGLRSVALRTRHRGGPQLAEVQAGVAERIGVVGGRAHRRPAPGGRPGESVEVAVARSRPQESAYVAHWLRRAHLMDGVPWEQMAVIARAGAQQDALRRALTSGGVPVEVDRAGLPLGLDPAVEPVLVAFDVVTRPAVGAWEVRPEEAISLLTGPFGQVDPVHLRRLRRRVRTQELAEGGTRTADEILADLLIDEELRATTPAELHPDLAPLVRVGSVLDAGRAVASADPAGSAEDVLWTLWQASGLAESWGAQALAGGALGARADRDLDAILVLFGAAESYVERLPGSRARGFLDHVRSAEVAADTLVVGARTGSAVEVLTPQAAAGRQWSHVAVVGVQDGVWPDLRLRDTLLGAEALVAVLRGQPAHGAEAVRAAQAQVRADELRQFHVAITRADRQLLVTAVASTDDQPSGFLDLVDPAHRDRPQVDVPPALTLRGLVGQLRREAVLAQRSGRRADRDAAVDTLALLAEAGVPGVDPSTWWDTLDVSTTRDLVPTGPVRVSPSQVQTYLDCALRWLLQGRGAETGEATGADVGILVHDIVAKDPDADGPTLVEELDRRWPELRLGEGWISDKQQAAARRMVERYATYVQQAAADGRVLLGTEIPMRARFTAQEDEKAREVLITGQVDRLERAPDGRLVVLDLKTSRSKPSAEEIVTHAQLAAYQVAVEEGAFRDLAPGGAGGARLVNLGIKEKALTQEQQPLGESEDPRWAHRLLATAAAGMAGHEFTAHDQAQRCRTCPVRFCCPLQPEGQQR